MKCFQKQSLGGEAQGALVATEVALTESNVQQFLLALNQPDSGCEVNLSVNEVRQLEGASYDKQGYMAPFRKGALDRIISKTYPDKDENDISVTVLAVEDNGYPTLVTRIDSSDDKLFCGNSFAVNKNDFASFIRASATGQKK